MKVFENKNVVVSGGSRGIGLSIARKLASSGANIAILAKTDIPHPKLPGTIFSAAKELEKYDVKVLPIKTDIRFEEQVNNAYKIIADKFNTVDILINNASAISLFNSETLPLKQFDLMYNINVRGTYLCSKTFLPLLKKSINPHILNLSPPINLNPKWFDKFTAYTISKFGMSMCVIGMSEEFKKYNIAVNALWPRTTINTAALNNLGGAVDPNQCRTEDILADSAFYLFQKDSKICTGNFFIDEEILKAEGINDFSKYSVKQGEKLFTDLFLE